MILIGWKPLVKTLKAINQSMLSFLRKHDDYINNKIIPIVSVIHWGLGILAIGLVIAIISLQTFSDAINGNNILGMLVFRILVFFVMVLALNKILIRSNKKVRLQLRLLIS